MSDFRSLADTQKALKGGAGVHLATVLDVDIDKGVKIKLDGQEETNVPNIYYNSLQVVNVGDRVYIVEISGSMLVIGKLLY